MTTRYTRANETLSHNFHNTSNINIQTLFYIRFISLVTYSGKSRKQIGRFPRVRVLYMYGDLLYPCRLDTERSRLVPRLSSSFESLCARGTDIKRDASPRGDSLSSLIGVDRRVNEDATSIS